MIELTLKLIDKIIQLLALKEKRREALVNDLVKPTFEEASRIHTDYLQMFEQATADLSDRGAPLAEVAARLRRQRIELEALRVKLAELGRRLGSSDLPTGVKGYVEALARYFPTGDLSPISSPSSAVLDRLGFYSDQESAIPDIEDVDGDEFGLPWPSTPRDEVLGLLAATMDHLRYRWMVVCDQYAAAIAP